MENDYIIMRTRWPLSLTQSSKKTLKVILGEIIKLETGIYMQIPVSNDLFSMGLTGLWRKGIALLIKIIGVFKIESFLHLREFQ
jgi:hypothetical protein